MALNWLEMHLKHILFFSFNYGVLLFVGNYSCIFKSRLLCTTPYTVEEVLMLAPPSGRRQSAAWPIVIRQSVAVARWPPYQ